MVRKLMAVLLSIMIIFSTVFISYQEVEANPLLLLLGACADALGLSTALTGGLFYSLDTNKGLNVESPSDAFYNYVGENKALQIVSHLVQAKVTQRQLTTELVTDYAGRIKDYFLNQLHLTIDNDNISYQIPTTYPITYDLYNYNNYGNAYSPSDVTSINSKIDNNSDYLTPFMTYDFINSTATFYEGSAGYRTSYLDMSSYLKGLDDGIYQMSVESYYFSRIDLTMNSSTNSVYHTKRYTSTDMRGAFFKIITIDGVKYFKCDSSSIPLTNNVNDYVQIVAFNQFNNFPVDIDINRFESANFNNKALTDLGVSGDIVTIPKSATVKSINDSQAVRNTTTKAVSYANASTVVNDDPMNPPAEEVSFWNAVTGWMGNFWTKLNTWKIGITDSISGLGTKIYEDMNVLGATICDGLGLTVSTEAEAIRQKVADEAAKDRLNAQTQTGVLGGTITGEGDAIRRKLQEESEKDRANTQAQTGAIVGSVDGVKGAVDGVKDSVDDLSKSIADSNTGTEFKYPEMKVPADTLKNKFPFSIPWDLTNAVKSLVATPQAPKWTIDFPKEYFVGGGTVVIDFSQFEVWAKIVRWGVLIAFNIFLILGTRKIIGAS